MESKGNKNTLPMCSSTKSDNEKKDVQISMALVSDQFCIKMFDYMVF